MTSIAPPGVSVTPPLQTQFNISDCSNSERRTLGRLIQRHPSPGSLHTIDCLRQRGMVIAWCHRVGSYHRTEYRVPMLAHAAYLEWKGVKNNALV